MSARAPWSATIELRGAGGEPVDFVRTLLSHGVADLPPNVIEPGERRLRTVLSADGGAWLVEVSLPDPAAAAGPAGASHPAAAQPSPESTPDPAAAQPSPAVALVRAAPGSDPPPNAVRGGLLVQVRHMLRLDEDLSAFYLLAARDPDLAWVTSGAGRMLRSPTVFEDLVKTICTTNCAWSATVRMVSAIVGELGIPAAGAPQQRAFPSPESLAQADAAFFRDVARTGYRGPYLRELAANVAERRLDLEALGDPALPDDEVAERLLSLAGVGPYAAAHMMMLLGRYHRLILDSWTRPKYRRITARARITDKGIVRAFRRYRHFAGLAFWLTLTEDWVDPPRLS